MLLLGPREGCTPGCAVGRLPGENGGDWVEEEEGRAVGWAGCPRRKGTDVQAGPPDAQGLEVQEGDSRWG